MRRDAEGGGGQFKWLGISKAGAGGLNGDGASILTAWWVCSVQHSVSRMNTLERPEFMRPITLGLSDLRGLTRTSRSISPASEMQLVVILQLDDFIKLQETLYLLRRPVKAEGLFSAV